MRSNSRSHRSVRRTDRDRRRGLLARHSLAERQAKRNAPGEQSFAELARWYIDEYASEKKKSVAFRTKDPSQPHTDARKVFAKIRDTAEFRDHITPHALRHTASTRAEFRPRGACRPKGSRQLSIAPPPPDIA